MTLARFKSGVSAMNSTFTSHPRLTHGFLSYLTVTYSPTLRKPLCTTTLILMPNHYNNHFKHMATQILWVVTFFPLVNSLKVAISLADYPIQEKISIWRQFCTLINRKIYTDLMCKSTASQVKWVFRIFEYLSVSMAEADLRCGIGLGTLSTELM